MIIIQKSIEFFLKKKWLGILLILGLAAGLGISTFYRGAISPKQRTDLTVFLKAGERIAEGRAREIYESENARHWRYVYPPILAILLAPVSKWPLGVAVILAYLFSLACLAGTCILSRRFIKTGGPAPWQIVLALIFCLPLLMNTLSRGQFGIITLFFAAAIFYNYLQKHKVLAGLLLAFAVTLKISPLAFLVFFFLKKREWTTLLSTVLGFILFFFIFPSLVIGFHQNWELLKTWHNLMSISQSDSACHNYLWAQLFTPFAEDNQSLYAVLTRFAWLSEAKFLGHSNAFIREITLALNLLLLALPFLQTRPRFTASAKELPETLAEFSLFSMLMLFSSPVTQIHHYTVVYFLFLAVFMLMDRVPSASWTRKSLESCLWICGLSLMLGMLFSFAGYGGTPLWGSMLLWGVVLFCLNRKTASGS